MKWRKLGRIFCAKGQHSWMQSHTAVPIAEHITDNLYRIYFSARDEAQRSHTGFVVIDLQRPDSILELSATPVLSRIRIRPDFYAAMRPHNARAVAIPRKYFV